MKQNILVAGAGGFIGGHLVSLLRGLDGVSVRGVDIKPLNEWFQRFPDVESISTDLQDKDNCQKAVQGIDHIYNLAADMGGMGFIERNKALCMLSVLINTHLLMAAKESGVRRFFFSSSACVYNMSKQAEPGVTGLKEEDAYPAYPEDGYGWEKLFSERMCRHFSEDFGLETRIARIHNSYGPQGTWKGGREKAPAAICRKVIEAVNTGSHEIEIWGDGSATRSFLFVKDCVEGIYRIMNSDINEPLNLGSEEQISVNQLVDLVEEIAGSSLKRTYLHNMPTGVRGRNSDNIKISKLLGWSPSIALKGGLEETYHWIEKEFKRD